MAPEGAPEIISTSPSMARVLDLVRAAASSTAPVLIEGETGTGKELLARAIHHAGPRARGPFAAFNCAAVPETLLESELFGYVRGAFTGAEHDRHGLFEIAAGGTLFLDEIGDTPHAIQPKLLRVLQSGEVRPLGTASTRRIDVRPIAASNRNLEHAVATGAFRADLYFRLHVLAIHIPPLRDRPEDIPLLASHFLARWAAVEHHPPLTLDPPALAALVHYPWPGNVRELESELRRVVLCANGPLVHLDDLAPRIRTAAEHAPAPQPLDAILRDVESAVIRKRLATFAFNRSRTAASLGLTREGFYGKLSRLGLRHWLTTATPRPNHHNHPLHPPPQARPSS